MQRKNVNPEKAQSQRKAWYKKNSEKIRAQRRAWRKANPEEARAKSIKASRKQGHRPMAENKECAMFLGVHVAERVLSYVFKDVEKMPMCNPGYDFICNRGKKIDVKSACLKRNGRSLGMWTFAINKNITADYFLCLAFDSREDLNPIHLWLLPSAGFNDKMVIGISLSTINKWDEYRLETSNVISCCEAMKV